MWFVAVAAALAGLSCQHAPSSASRSEAPRERARGAAGLYQGMLRDARWVMGTRLVIALEAPDKQRGRALLAAAFSRVEELDRLLSHYRRESPLSRLNRRELRGPLPLELVRFAELARRYCEATRGLFDVTASSLGAPARTDRAGGTAPVRRTGCGRLAVQGREVQLAPETTLDPGGIGKGYAVDALVRLFVRQGVRRAFVDFGGSSFFGLGHPEGRPGWPVLIRGVEPERILGVAHLRDRALSSSSSASDEGRPHIFDPRSGKLVREARVAAVLSPSATDAEVLSTALIVDPSAAGWLGAHFPAMGYASSDRNSVLMDQEFARVMGGEL